MQLAVWRKQQKKSGKEEHGVLETCNSILKMKIPFFFIIICI